MAIRPLVYPVYLNTYTHEILWAPSKRYFTRGEEYMLLQFQLRLAVLIRLLWFSSDATASQILCHNQNVVEITIFASRLHYDDFINVFESPQKVTRLMLPSVFTFMTPRPLQPPCCKYHLAAPIVGTIEPNRKRKRTGASNDPILGQRLTFFKYISNPHNMP